MKILITGGKGMLGRTLQRESGGENEIIVADLPEWDITDDEAFTAKTLEASPDLIIHCAAMTKVDDCETNRDLAFKLNEEGTRNVAMAAKSANARLIAISTDYVFSGEPPHEPWAWSETDIPRPRTVYGASKFAGEQMIQMIHPDKSVILRIAWLYGEGGPSFIHTMAKLGQQEGAPLKVVNDQRGNPTSCKTVADVIRFLMTKKDVSGIVHGTCENQCTWYELTKELFGLLGLKREVVPCSTEEFPRPAPRPHNSALKKSVLNVLGYRTPDWKVALAEFVKTTKLTCAALVTLFASTACAGNAWLEDWNTPYGVPPFERLTLSDYRTAVEAAIAAEDAEIAAIVANKEPPTFTNTIAALDRAGILLTRIDYTFDMLFLVERTDEAVAAKKALIPLRTAHNAAIACNQPLFERVAAVYRADQSKLTTEEKIVLERRYKKFVRNGAALNAEGQRRLKEILARLSELTIEFETHVLNESNAFKKRFGIDVAEYYEAMANEPDRARREAIFKAYNARCRQGGVDDNRAIFLEVMKLRAEQAKLLGYASSADYFIEPRMAKNAAGAEAFLSQILKAANAAVRCDVDAFSRAMAKDVKEGKLPAGSVFEPWDYYYYSNRLRHEASNFDEQTLKPYFKLENVVKGMFLAAERLYGIKMEELSGLPTYHAGETTVYRVTGEKGEYVGILYTDWHPRATKACGAWMNNIREQYVDAKGEDVRPIIYNDANVGDYLTLEDVRTLFHEFGHGLHGLLSKCTYRTVQGTYGQADYSEIFSQINENWALNDWLLSQYAIDARTGKALPKEMIDRIRATERSYMAWTVAQVALAAGVDLRWHETTDFTNIDVDAYERQILKDIGCPSCLEPRYHSTYFKHMMDTEYSAGYYAYLWAEVLDHDLFSIFVQSGDVWNPVLARKFRDTFLTRGGSEDPMKLFRSFAGREPDPKAYFKAKGL